MLGNKGLTVISSSSTSEDKRLVSRTWQSSSKIKEVKTLWKYTYLIKERFRLGHASHSGLVGHVSDCSSS